MFLKMTRDVISGLLVIVFSGWFALHAYFYYPLGTLVHIGPGFFPFWVGVILVCVGVAVAVKGLSDTQVVDDWELKPLLAVSFSVFVFAVGVTYGGMVPAIALSVACTMLAEPRLRSWVVVYIIVGLSIIGAVIFRYLLGIQMPLFRWPF